MKVPTNAPRSSFGIPKEATEQIDNLRQQKESADKIRQEVSEPPAKNEEWPMAEAVEVEEEVSTVTPEAILKRIGIEPTEDDYHSLLFRGFVEKVVPVAQIPGGRKLSAKIKTLTAEEVEWVDEFLARDIESTKMTNSGLDFRRAGWTMAFAILELEGRPIAKNVLVDGVVDHKKTAEERRKVIAKLSPYVIDKIIRIHAEMSAAFNVIITEPTGDLVKK